MCCPPQISGELEVSARTAGEGRCVSYTLGPGPEGLFNGHPGVCACGEALNLLRVWPSVAWLLREACDATLCWTRRSDLRRTLGVFGAQCACRCAL